MDGRRSPVRHPRPASFLPRAPPRGQEKRGNLRHRYDRGLPSPAPPTSAALGSSGGRAAGNPWGPSDEPGESSGTRGEGTRTGASTVPHMKRAWVLILAVLGLGFLVTGLVLLMETTKASYDRNDGTFATYTVLECGNALSSKHEEGYELIVGSGAADIPVDRPGSAKGEAATCADARRPKQ